MGKYDSKVTNTSEPPEYLKPVITKLAGETEKLYNSGTGFKTYTGPRVAGMSRDTTSAINLIRQRAGQGPSAGLASAGVRSGLENESLRRLRGVASSDPARNPFVDQIISDTQDDAADSIAQRFSASGRYGSGAMGKVMGAELGKIGTQLRYDDFSRGLARKDMANSQILDSESAFAGRRAAVDAQINEQEDKRLASLAMAGQQQQAQSQAELDAKRAQFDESQNEKWRRIGAANSILQPQAQAFASQTQTSQGGSGQGLQTGLGAGLGFLSLLPMLFGLSDKRAKKDISAPIGETEDGIPIRTWKYKKGGPFGLKEDGPTMMGVIAQEAKKKRPDAVGKIGKYLAVDYGAL